MNKDLAAATTSNGRFVWNYLKPLLPGLSVATGLSIALGLVSAALGALVGPSLQIISATPGTVLTFKALFSPRLGEIATALAGTPGMTASDLLTKLPPLLIILAIVKAVVGSSQWLLFERAGELVSLKARDDIVSSYLSLSPIARRSDEARKVEGSLSSAMTSDVRLMREFIVHYYGGLPREIFEIIFLTVTMVLLSPKLTAVFFVGVLPAGIVFSKVGRLLRKRAARALADYSDLSEWLQQRLLGIETIKHYKTENIEIEKMHALTESLYQRFLRAARVKARTSPLLQAVAVGALVVVLGVALFDVAAGHATGSVQLSFLTTVALLSDSAGKLGRYLNSNREGAAAVDRLRAALGHLLPLGEARVALRAVQGSPRVVCKNIEARYDRADQQALRGVSCELVAGRIYCFAGPSGAGKSTLFNLILGLLKPERGELRIEAPNGDDNLTVCYMPQKVLLAPDSIAANVAYPSPVWDVGRVQGALARVGMNDVVTSLPEGVETLVGDGGKGLSGGQAQRILLARLWYHRAPIVLVDEGTSALDPEVERVVHDLLRELAKSGSVVVTIAHRPGSAEIADDLLLLDGGKLVASGSPREVMGSPIYQRLLS